MFGVSQEASKSALMMEMIQVEQGREALPVSEEAGDFSIGQKVKKMSYQPAASRLPVSRPWPGVGSPVTSREIVRAKRSVRFGSPDLLETVISHFRRNWFWYLGGAVAFVLLVVLVSGGQDEGKEKERGSEATS